MSITICYNMSVVCSYMSVVCMGVCERQRETENNVICRARS
jgi:hypothetical protein